MRMPVILYRTINVTILDREANLHKMFEMCYINLASSTAPNNKTDINNREQY